MLFSAWRILLHVKLHIKWGSGSGAYSSAGRPSLVHYQAAMPQQQHQTLEAIMHNTALYCALWPPTFGIAAVEVLLGCTANKNLLFCAA